MTRDSYRWIASTGRRPRDTESKHAIDSNRVKIHHLLLTDLIFDRAFFPGWSINTGLVRLCAAPGHLRRSIGRLDSEQLRSSFSSDFLIFVICFIHVLLLVGCLRFSKAWLSISSNQQPWSNLQAFHPSSTSSNWRWQIIWQARACHP